MLTKEELKFLKHLKLLWEQDVVCDADVKTFAMSQKTYCAEQCPYTKLVKGTPFVCKARPLPRGERAAKIDEFLEDHYNQVNQVKNLKFIEGL